VIHTSRRAQSSEDQSFGLDFTHPFDIAGNLFVILNVYMGEETNSTWRSNMKNKTKIAILLVAVIITLAGFNLMSSPSAIDIMKVGKPTAYHVDVTVTAKHASAAQPTVRING
jgi:hypothetical protein